MPRRLSTLKEAQRFIAHDVPGETRKLPRWTFAAQLVEHAIQTGKQRDIALAERQLRQALSNDHWLAPAENP